ncbi:MAG: ferrous iron transport protein B [Clostridiales bacterium]|nr:ferrous iron transport protein B [Clostridiales bacterium]
MQVALIGNQNSGKTTLFNQLTGSNQRVGNFPGVTVEGKEGIIRGHKDIILVDLPGIYSLSAYTNEETVTRDFLLNKFPDGIINIVDATNIERNLYLTMQLIQLEIPTVVALNMMDEVTLNGASINLDILEKELGVSVVPISASKNEGIDELIEVAADVIKNKKVPLKQDFCKGTIHRTLHAIAHLVEDVEKRTFISAKFIASKLIENDSYIINELDIGESKLKTIEYNIIEMEKEIGLDRKAAMADMRYTFIENVCRRAVKKPLESKQHRRSVRIDSVLTHKYLAIPIFLAIMALIFWLTFGIIGSFFNDALAYVINELSEGASYALKAYGINPVVHDLIVNGIFAGVGSVVSFIPTIIILFLFLSLLEDSGYMARVAFVMDKCLRKIGLSGKSFVPMLIGFGCTVPAIMSARTLSSERDRKMTIFLTPFMSCSAKLPIYGLITMAFFPKYRTLVIISLYVLSICVGVLLSFLSQNLFFRGSTVPFIMELPNYRMPTLRNTIMLLWEKTRDFLVRAFTVIFVATVVVWFLQTFDTRINVVSDSSRSILATIGKYSLVIFRPLGFNDWRIPTALITGFIAKETVVSSFVVLMGQGVDNINAFLGGIFTPLTAYVFLIFTLLYTPCVAAISVVKKELNSALVAFMVVVGQTFVSWVIAFLVYRLALIII